MLKKIIYLILIFHLLIINPAVCAADTAEKLTVILDWFPNPDHAPLILAKELGYFADANLDVDLIGPADPSDPPKIVAAGKADLAITYEPEFIVQVDQGMPLIRIGTLIDKPLDCVLALKSSGITSLRDLKGKRIGSGADGLSNNMLNIMLKHHQITANDVEIINVHYNLSQALLTHQVDAVTGMMRNFEIPQIEAERQQVIAFLPEENGIPHYSVLIFVSHLNRAHDPRFARFLLAIKRATIWLGEHPDAGWKLFANHYPEANNPVNRASWFATMPHFTKEPAVFSTKDWQHFVNFMFNNKMIRQVQPISRYAVTL
jgi:putative hydroxymethylpyrimidine transport system substrate-binding protein